MTSPRLRTWISDLGPLVAITLFALLLCRPVLQGRVPVATDTLALWAPWSQLPHEPVRNTAVADSAHQFLPWMVFARDAVASGEWPLWDPYTFSGSSFAANSQNQIYYPVSWLLWLLPLNLALRFLAVLNVCLAGWGMYTFLRVGLGASRFGSLLGALAFAGSGMLQTAVNTIPIASVYGWLPWFVLAADRAVICRSARWTALAALAGGTTAVAGQLQWVVYSYFAAACWLLFRSVQMWLAERGREGTRSAGAALAGSIARSALVLGGGIVLASVHLAPFFELSALAGRTGVRTSSNSEPLAHLLRLVLPQYFGTPMVLPNYSLGSSNLWYVGLLPLLLAPVAVISGFRRSGAAGKPAWTGRAVPLFWLGLGLFAVLVAYGIGPFLYVRWLPGLSSTPPVRIGYLLIASLSVLTALGFDVLLAASKESPARARRLLVALALGPVLAVGAGWYGSATFSNWAVGAAPAGQQEALLQLQRFELWKAAALGVLLVLSLVLLLRGAEMPAGARLWPLSAGWLAPISLVGIAGLDLLSAIPGFTSFVPPESVLRGAPSIEWLRAQPGQWRILGVDNPLPSFVPDTHLPHRLATAAGYESLHDRRYDEFWRTVDQSIQFATAGNPYANVFVRPQAYTSTLASLLNVRYVAAVGELSPPDGFRKVYSSEVNIYENLRVLPRAFLVGSARALPPEEILERLGSPDFEPGTEVLVEAAPPEWMGAEASAGTPGEVSIVEYRRNRVVLDASLARPVWLVLADNYNPGWSVSVDGRPRQIFRADYILRAVPLEAGRHRVEFEFVPTAFWPTLGLSFGTLLLVAAVILRPQRRS